MNRFVGNLAHVHAELFTTAMNREAQKIPTRPFGRSGAGGPEERAK